MAKKIEITLNPKASKDALAKLTNVIRFAGVGGPLTIPKTIHQSVEATQAQLDALNNSFGKGTFIKGKGKPIPKLVPAPESKSDDDNKSDDIP